MHPIVASTALIGKGCWYVSAGGVTAPSFMLVLGGKIPRPTPLKNPAQSMDFRSYRGSVELLVWCSWRLQRGAEVLASSAQERVGLSALDGVIDSTIVEAFCSPPAWDLRLHFSNNLEIVVFCDQVEPGASIAQNWELWTPQGYVGTGPGADWGEDPTVSA